MQMQEYESTLWCNRKKVFGIALDTTYSSLPMSTLLLTAPNKLGKLLEEDRLVRACQI